MPVLTADRLKLVQAVIDELNVAHASLLRLVEEEGATQHATPRWEKLRGLPADVADLQRTIEGLYS